MSAEHLSADRRRLANDDAEPPRGLPLDPEGDGTPLSRASRVPKRGRSVDTQSPDYPDRVAEAMGISGDRLRASRPVEPWRFDVPEVPPHVTALKDVEGEIWLRLADGAWQCASDPVDAFANFVELVRFTEFTPLVECPDPRAAS